MRHASRGFNTSINANLHCLHWWHSVGTFLCHSIFLPNGKGTNCDSGTFGTPLCLRSSPFSIWQRRSSPFFGTCFCLPSNTCKGQKRDSHKNPRTGVARFLCHYSEQWQCYQWVWWFISKFKKLRCYLKFPRTQPLRRFDQHWLLMFELDAKELSCLTS